MVQLEEGGLHQVPFVFMQTCRLDRLQQQFNVLNKDISVILFCHLLLQLIILSFIPYIYT